MPLSFMLSTSIKKSPNNKSQFADVLLYFHLTKMMSYCFGLKLFKHNPAYVMRQNSYISCCLMSWIKKVNFIVRVFNSTHRLARFFLDETRKTIILILHRKFGSCFLIMGKLKIILMRMI